MRKFSEKTLLENKEIDFKNGVENIQAVGYNGARLFYESPHLFKSIFILV